MIVVVLGKYRLAKMREHKPSTNQQFRDCVIKSISHPALYQTQCDLIFVRSGSESFLRDDLSQAVYEGFVHTEALRWLMNAMEMFGMESNELLPKFACTLMGRCK